jgi:hypothetical protein
MQAIIGILNILYSGDGDVARNSHQPSVAQRRVLASLKATLQQFAGGGVPVPADAEIEEH